MAGCCLFIFCGSHTHVERPTLLPGRALPFFALGGRIADARRRVADGATGRVFERRVVDEWYGCLAPLGAMIA